MTPLIHLIKRLFAIIDDGCTIKFNFSSKNCFHAYEKLELIINVIYLDLRISNLDNFVEKKYIFVANVFKSGKP